MSFILLWLWVSCHSQPTAVAVYSISLPFIPMVIKKKSLLLVTYESGPVDTNSWPSFSLPVTLFGTTSQRHTFAVSLDQVNTLTPSWHLVLASYTKMHHNTTDPHLHSFLGLSHIDLVHFMTFHFFGFSFWCAKAWQAAGSRGRLQVVLTCWQSAWSHRRSGVAVYTLCVHTWQYQHPPSSVQSIPGVKSVHNTCQTSYSLVQLSLVWNLFSPHFLIWDLQSIVPNGHNETGRVISVSG